MRVYVDVYNAAGERQGGGPVDAVVRADFTRRLDGAGGFTLECVGTNARALALLALEARVHIWGDDRNGVRLLGAGIIRNRSVREASGSVGLVVDGPDLLDELKRRTVHLARIYSQERLEDVVDALVGLASGWTATVDAAIADDLVDLRLDGVSVLRGLQELAGRYGYHLRMSDVTAREVVIGPFGEDSGLRVMRVERVTSQVLANPKLLMVQRITPEESSEGLYNWLVPLGAGEGEAALTLEQSTRTTPYAIQTMAGPDGGTLYYIADAGSIAAYGEIQRVGRFKEIGPLSNSESDLALAADALYDAAVVDMQRAMAPVDEYKVTLKNVKQTLLPGQKIRMDYRADLEVDGAVIEYIAVRGDYWLLEVDEQIGIDGVAVSATISSVDAAQPTAASAVMDAIEDIELRTLKPAPSSGVRSYVYDREIDATHSALVPLEFTDATTRLLRVRMRLKSAPFRATAQGGPHRHKMFGILSWTDGVQLSGVSNLFCRVSEASGAATNFLFQANAGAGSATELWTEGAGGGITYGIVDDTATPAGMTVWVNGVNETLALAGAASIAPGGGAASVVLDVAALTDLILNASGGWQRAHTIEVRAGSGQGRVEVTVEVFEVTQAIRLG
jgi:hypothetical protein